MDITHDRLVEILRSRYDYYSARAVLVEALEKQTITAKAAYPPAEVEKIAEHLVARRDRTEQVAAHLRAELRPGAPAPAPAPVAAPPAAPAASHAPGAHVAPGAAKPAPAAEKKA